MQLFDSWVGALSPADYEEFVAPYSARILAAVECPTIHFGTGTATLLEPMADAGGDVIGLDWRIPLDWGWARVGETAACRATSTRRVLLRAVGADRGGGARRARPRRRPARATSSTSATASFPAPTPTCSAAPAREYVHARHASRRVPLHERSPSS